MLGKLVKYELKATGKLIPIAYLAVAILAAFAILLSVANQFVYVVLSFFLLFLAGAAAMIITYVIVFLRYHRGVFGSEGYLAMTLPVSTRQLYLSKTIATSLWLILSNIVTTIAWFSALFSIFSTMEFDMKEYFYEMGNYFSNFLPGGVIVLLIIYSLVGILSFVSQMFFSLTVVNVRPFQNMGIGGAIIVYIVLLVVTAILNTILTLAFPYYFIYEPSTGWRIGEIVSGLFGSYYSYKLSVTSILFPFLYAFVLPILNIFLLERKVNLK